MAGQGNGRRRRAARRTRGFSRSNLWSRRPPRVGDVVLTKHPFQSDVLMVKRIASIDATGRLFVIGDNPDESSDSRSFGSLRTDAVIGKVVGKVP